MQRHIRDLLSIVVLVSVLAPVPAVAAPEPAPWWPAPAGWRREVQTFPLAFAPGLAHHGTNELRFPAAFGKPEDPRFFTYAFVWALKAPDRLRYARLAEELKTYYDGLVTFYGNPQPGVPFTGTRVHVACEGGRLRADVETIDPFFTHAALNLTVRVREVRGLVAGHRTYLFLASPRPSDALVREALETVEGALQVR